MPINAKVNNCKALLTFICGYRVARNLFILNLTQEFIE